MTPVGSVRLFTENYTNRLFIGYIIHYKYNLPLLKQAGDSHSSEAASKGLRSHITLLNEMKPLGTF
jgi:hypothetical protein